jgi:hypothetical protein
MKVMMEFLKSLRGRDPPAASQADGPVSTIENEETRANNQAENSNPIEQIDEKADVYKDIENGVKTIQAAQAIWGKRGWWTIVIG